jgi:integrase
MSLYVVGNVIYIIQLQGFCAINIPVPLRNWPRRFVAACQELAIKNRFKQVRIGKANWLYRNLTIREYETTTELEATLEAVRMRMQSHYDGTARELGFAEKGNWFVWENPHYCGWVQLLMAAVCRTRMRVPLAHIDRRLIAEQLSSIAAKRGPASANRARATLSAFFVWAWREGLVEQNPVVATNRHGGDKGRDRVLTMAELAEVWRAAGDSAYGAIVRLLILTGQRRTEIGSLRWREIDFEARLIRLPGERTKNHQAHDVPLSEPAMRLLQAMPRIGEFVFGTAAIGFCAYTDGNAALDKRIAMAREAAGTEPMLPWVQHDLRRSVATHMAEIGIQPHIIEAVLNHVSGHKAGIAGIYNKATYDREKRMALDLWSEHVMAIVQGRIPTW